MDIIDQLRDMGYQPYLTLILVMISCLCFYFFKSDNKNLKTIALLGAYLIFIISLFIFCSSTYSRLKNPQVWDFTAFYLYGKAGVTGHNYYSPQNFLVVFNSLTVPELNYADFIEQTVNVGFLYPPSTILLFSPLGFLSYKTALICWTIFNLLFAIGSIYLIYSLFFKKYKLYGLMFVATMFFLLSPVRMTVCFSQTNFILLFLLLLMKKYSDKKYAGIFLALAFFTKPYMIIFGLIFLLRKQWKTLIYFTIVSLVLGGITFFLFGKEPFITYIVNNPSGRLPDRVFSENINQSLHAVLIRAHLITANTPHVYTLVSATILLLMGMYSIYLLKRKRYDYIWAILLLVGLLVYPGTLSYYGVLLLFIVFQFFDGTKQLGFKNKYLNTVLIGIFYYLSSVSVFSVIIFLLLILIFKSLQNLNKKVLSGAYIIH
jgi:hypothetical protein